MKNFLKSGFAKVTAGVSALVASVGAFAVDHSAAITAAQTDATSNLTAGSVAVITSCAVIMGVALLIGLFRRI